MIYRHVTHLTFGECFKKVAMKKMVFFFGMLIVLQSCSSDGKHNGIYRGTTPYKEVMVIVDDNTITLVDSEKGEKQFECNQTDKSIQYQTYQNDVVRQLTVDPNNNLMLNNDVTLQRIK